MLDSIQRAAGLRAGLYTSPHLERINERIRLDGREISDLDFAGTFTRLRKVIEELLAVGKLAAHPTFLSASRLWRLKFFARAGAQIAVCEVGMGGRLDATNILLPEVAVITQIDVTTTKIISATRSRKSRRKKPASSSPGLES